MKLPLYSGAKTEALALKNYYLIEQLSISFSVSRINSTPSLNSCVITGLEIH